MNKKASSFKKIKIVTKNTLRESKKKSNLLIALKLFLIIIVVLGLYYYNAPFTNSISLLAVNENDAGNVRHGSIVELSLTTKPGTGNIFINLNTLGEKDTQVSLVNSQRIACNLFEIDCSKYDFYYEFSDNSAIVIKGPSGSSGIAILVANNLLKQKIPKDVTITGSLNSKGLVGVVGGVEKKIEVASKKGFSKVLVPKYSNYNYSKENSSIEVIEVLDIVDAFNAISNSNYVLDKTIVESIDYKSLMIQLSDEMCKISQSLRDEINISEIKENTTINTYFKAAIRSYNSSQIADTNSNYYSKGSFCFNANTNYGVVKALQENLTLNEREIQIDYLKMLMAEKSARINSNSYQAQIITINDFYTYLIINDRLAEANELIRNLDELKLNESLNNSDYNRIKFQKDVAYSYAKERFNTVELWEQFITHSGSKISFTEKNINIACDAITKQIILKGELIESYGVKYLDEEVSNQIVLSNRDNKYLCIYKGFELDGRMNTILSVSGIRSVEMQNYSKEILDFTSTRVNLNANGDFPLIPIIYSEYAQDLFEQNDYTSSLLYSNFALSYSDLNLYLEDHSYDTNYFNEVFSQLFNNMIFVLGMLLIIAFI